MFWLLDDYYISIVTSIDTGRYMTAADYIIGTIYAAYSVSVSAMKIKFWKFTDLIFYTD